jgi:ATP-dependent DNA helicase DinG
MNVWKKEEQILSREQEEQIDGFFSNLETSKTLEYREGQHTMALDIADAIKDRSILLIESGVGSGKSWAYLVPLLYASSGNDKFKGFIISTSSKALQDQLKKEIETLSDMLELPKKIDVTIAKGRSNYLCKRRFEYFAKSHDRQKEKIESIQERIEQGKVERADYQDLSQIDWKKMNVDKVRCTNCLYESNCTYRAKRKRWPESKAVICNHNLLVESLKRDSERPLLREPSILIVDEAHALEEKIRDSYKKVLNKQELESLIYGLYRHMNKDIKEDIAVIGTINELFRRISTNAKREYLSHSMENIDFFDSENSSFKCTKSVTNLTETLIKQLSDLEEEAIFNKKYNREKDFLEQINTLQETKRAFQDLILSNEDQKNVYWAAFLPDTLEHIEIQYVPRNIPELAKRLLNNPNYGKVFTSATLTAEGDYEYFAKGLGIDSKIGSRITSEEPLHSPFNYSENALLYCPTDLVSPKDSNREAYLDSITTKIDELLDITEGRTLVLFTAKKDMQEVYAKITERERPYNVYIQEEGKDTEIIKNKFKEDTTSCLFATGSFWEGIDIKGDSLESVIIPKLPFHVVDPIMDSKANYYAGGTNTVYLQDMLIKLKQGAGRLIRSEKDKGIVSILDSRVKDYARPILATLPFDNVTADINEVIAFKDNNLVKSKEQAKEYKKI